MTGEHEEIPFGRPWITDADKAAVARVMESPILAHGPEGRGFEDAFTRYTGGGHSVALSSCTAALHLSYMQAGIGPGDEVLVPAQTHVATAHAVELVGAKPIFVDCDAQTGNVTAKALDEAITSKTRALSLVHFLGLPCDMPAIMGVATENDLMVVEDCALALGARVDGVHVGLWGDTGCFSFYPVKHITTGDGGMLISKHEEVAAAVGRLRAFQVDRNYDERALPGMYDVPGLGLNYRMSEMQAALGTSQLQRMEENLARRAENHARLRAGLEKIPGVRVLHDDDPKKVDSHYALSMVIDDAQDGFRDAVVRKLNQKGIGTSIYYPHPVPRMAYYRNKYGYDASAYPGAECVSDCGIALPVGVHVGLADMDRIVMAATASMEEARAEVPA